MSPTVAADLIRAKDRRNAAAYAVNAKSPAIQNAYHSDWIDFAD